MNTGRAVILKGVADFTTKASGLITFPIMALYVGAAGYGAWGQLVTIIGFLVPFAALGLGNAMVRFNAALPWSDRGRRQLMLVLALVFGVSVVISAIVAVFASVLNDLFLNWEHGTELFRVGAPLVALGALEIVMLEHMRARQWLQGYALLQLGQTILVVTAVLILLPAGYGVIGIVYAMLAIKTLLVLVMIGGLWVWHRPRDDEARGEGSSTRRMIAFGLPLVMAGLGLWMMNLGDRLVIGHYLDPASLGLYAAVFTFSAVIIAINAPFSLPLYPKLVAATSKGDSEEVKRIIRVFHRFAVLLLVPTMVFLVAFLPQILIVMGGAGFQVGAVLVTAIVIAVFLDQFNAVAHYLVLCADQVAFSHNTWISAGILNVVANIIVVPRYGLIGAAFVTLFSFLVLEVLFFFKANTRVPIVSLYRWDVLLKALIGSAIAVAVGFVGLAQVGISITGIIILAVLFGSTYTVAMFLLHELGRSDLDQVKKAILGG